ncbi:MAG: hypothetical protein AAGC68_15220 [Verrucomicrobiota bacterium]
MTTLILAERWTGQELPERPNVEHGRPHSAHLSQVEDRRAPFTETRQKGHVDELRHHDEIRVEREDSLQIRRPGDARPSRVAVPLGVLVEAIGRDRHEARGLDEAQDHDTAFPDALNDSGPHTECGWWSIYFALLREEKAAPVTLFYDTAQRPPFRGQGGFDARLVASQLSQPAFAKLPHALRYTQPIYDFLQTLNAPGTERLIAQFCEPDDLPEGPEIVATKTDSPNPDTIRAAVESIIDNWVEDGYCKPDEILLLHARTHLKDSVLGTCETLAGMPLREYGDNQDEATKCIRHLSINRAKGLDALGVILIGVRPFQEIQAVDHQYTYFMGASRAKQLLAVVHS